MLGGANTYSGATTINGGVLQLNDASALGNGGTLNFASGAQLNVNVNNATISKPVSLTGNGTQTIYVLTGNSATLSGNITADANTGTWPSMALVLPPPATR